VIEGNGRIEYFSPEPAIGQFPMTECSQETMPWVMEVNVEMDECL